MYLLPFLLCTFDIVLLFLFNILFKDDLDDGLDDGLFIGAVFDKTFLSPFFIGVNFVWNLAFLPPFFMPGCEFGLGVDFLLLGRLVLCEVLGLDELVLLAPPLLLGRLFDDEVDGREAEFMLLLLLLPLDRLDDGAV